MEQLSLYVSLKNRLERFKQCFSAATLIKMLHLINHLRDVEILSFHDLRHLGDIEADNLLSRKDPQWQILFRISPSQLRSSMSSNFGKLFNI